MNDADLDTTPPPPAWSATALQTIVTAAEWVIAAKRTHSTALIAQAERELQAAVDAARDTGIQWGPIGTALGIARGNAYQRYRKRLSGNGFGVEVSPANGNGHPAS